MPEEKKDEGKIVLQTCMHCEECRYELYKAIIGYPGVEDLSIDLKENKVTLKAPKVDAKKLFEVVKKKSKGKITKLLYPDPTEVKKEEEKKKEDKPPTEVTVVLKASMHCASCRRKVEKATWSIKDVQSVKREGQTLTIKGWDLDAKEVCKAIIKKSRKHAEVVPPKKDEEKKDGEKKDGPKKDEEKKDGEKKEGEKKDGDVKKDEKPNPQIVAYPPQYFSDENPNSCVVM